MIRIDLEKRSNKYCFTRNDISYDVWYEYLDDSLFVQSNNFGVYVFNLSRIIGKELVLTKNFFDIIYFKNKDQWRFGEFNTRIISSNSVRTEFEVYYDY